MRSIRYSVSCCCFAAATLGIVAVHAARPDGQGQSARPNELGKVLILEYHLIQPEESRWGRSIANFKRDLELLYRSDYRPVGMSEYVSGNMHLPEGTHPVLFTFDDSSPGQFRYLEHDGKRLIDPECAVGMLLDFHSLHPDFVRKAIFFVLPGAKEPHKLFGQPEYETEKLRQLIALGFEIGNHTLWHAQLNQYDAATVQKQLATPVKEIGTMVPGYLLRFLALPFGIYPKDPGLAVQGAYDGITYHNEAILRVTGGPAPSPFSRKRDLARLPRIQVMAGALEAVVKRFAAHPEEVYVSDGKDETVTFPRALEPEMNRARYSSLRAVPY